METVVKQEASIQQLVIEIKTLIVNAVGLHHVKLSDIQAETSLREGGLGLDSVDLLEVVVVIEQQYGFKVNDAETGKKYFRTIGTIAEWVQLQKSKNA